MIERIIELTDESILCRISMCSDSGIDSGIGKRMPVNLLVREGKVVDIYCHYLKKVGIERRCNYSGQPCKFFKPNGEINGKINDELKELPLHLLK